MTNPTATGFDAHTHLNLPPLRSQLQAVCNRARTAGITGWVIAGTAPEQWPSVRETASLTGGTPILGIHPWWAAQLHPEALEHGLRQLPHVLTHHGLGETGLDRLRFADGDQWNAQLLACRSQLTLAKQLNLPLTLHCVRAVGPLLQLLDEIGVPEAGGLVHAWTGKPGAAAEFIRRGLHISIGPGIFRGRGARQTVTQIPAHRLLLETDSPDWPLGDATHGEPADLLHVAQEVAILTGIPPSVILQQTAESARRLFRVKSS